jgi:hypothetical protein
VPLADLSIPVSLVWLARGLPCARIVEIDPWKCPPDPLAFLADSAILRGLGCSVQPAFDGAHLEGPPIREGVPEAKEQAVVHAEKIASPRSPAID